MVSILPHRIARVLMGLMDYDQNSKRAALAKGETFHGLVALSNVPLHYCCTISLSIPLSWGYVAACALSHSFDWWLFLCIVIGHLASWGIKAYLFLMASVRRRRTQMFLLVPSSANIRMCTIRSGSQTVSSGASSHNYTHILLHSKTPSPKPKLPNRKHCTPNVSVPLSPDVVLENGSPDMLCLPYTWARG
jgi:hypothetical protein